MNVQGQNSKPTVLVAPLDWGLGHATRCIPVISELLLQNCTVILAGDGKVTALLQQEFPDLEILNLRRYNIQYSKQKWLLPFFIIWQIPRILSAIKHERKWLKQVVEEYGIDAIISDNRYGLNHSKISTVFITHQLLVKAPSKLIQGFLQKLNYKYINRFSACWIPDVPAGLTFAGELSHPAKMPQVPVHYIGALSRFEAEDKEVQEKHLLILLSGPEPQRTSFERIILNELKHFKEAVVLIRGLPNEKEVLYVTSNITVFNHLPAKELMQKIREASFVISRCGYSTVMDIATLKKKSILVPTPGQTEQEYLAEHLLKNKLALTIPQHKFKLHPALSLGASFDYQIQEFRNDNSLSTTIQNFISRMALNKNRVAKSQNTS